MITEEQLKAGLERVKNDEEFVMILSDLGKVILSSYGEEWIQVEFGKLNASFSSARFWCQSVSLDFGAVTFWVETQVIGQINAKDLKVPQMKYIMVLDLDGKVDCVKLFTTMDEYGEALADYYGYGYRTVADNNIRTVIQPVRGV